MSLEVIAIVSLSFLSVSLCAWLCVQASRARRREVEIQMMGIHQAMDSGFDSVNRTISADHTDIQAWVERTTKDIEQRLDFVERSCCKKSTSRACHIDG